MTTTSDQPPGVSTGVPRPAVPTFDVYGPAGAVLLRIAEGTRLGERRRPEARVLLEEVWDEIGSGGSALHRCRAAQALGRLQDDPSLALQWHLRALLAADQVDDEPGVPAAAASVAATYPALHRDVADAHRRLGDVEPALRHLQLGRCALLALPDGPARDATAAAFDALEAQLG